MASPQVPQPCCWSGIRRLWRSWSGGTWEEQDEELEESVAGDEIRCIAYRDRYEAMAEVKLEGGEGDPVYFWKVRPGTCAEEAGVKPGDELVQVNAAEPALLFWKPAEEILPTTFGSVILWWKPTPPRPAGERTRINPKRRPKHEVDDEEDWELPPAQYPVSKAMPMGPGEWRCGSCWGANFDNQEHCRTCGLRDSRLPKRPVGSPWLWEPNQLLNKPSVIFPSEGLTKKDVETAAMKGINLSDPTGLPEAQLRAPSRRLR
mmetsp:Transcript_1007/g.2249  ORF Transcript_1007/g.2249 Transcript_1007/m.2249 type:complete len:261 (-) Transcript_1007:84-866(-)